MSSYTPEEPIAAIATALAPSALAVIRTSGKGCIELVSHVFSRPEALTKAAGYTMLYGWIIDPEKQASSADRTAPALEADSSENKASAACKADARIDEVMLSVYRAPKSFTGEDMVEISCHGGTAPVMAVYRLLLKNGFRAAERGEFSFRAYVNGKTDLTRAEAIREIIDSRTDESRSRAAGRLSGALFDELARVKGLLIRTTASIEAEIEYPEDEETIADAFDPAELIEARDALARLADTWAGEKLYQDGVRIVLAGRTNAGKSSLFNLLLKEERAIVSDIEGTTRDWIESWISFGGIPARLFDTAGLRQSDDVIEQSGVERSLDLAEDADIVLYLADAGAGLLEDDIANLKRLAAPQALKAGAALSAEGASGSKGLESRMVLVWNKCDVADATKAPAALKASDALSADNASGSAGDSALKSRLARVPQVRISAKTGEGIPELMSVVHELLSKQVSTSRQQAGLGSARQKASVDEALDSLNHALCVIAPDADTGLGLDAVVQDIEDALDSLAEITGETSPDDILENIFARFCVGK